MKTRGYTVRKERVFILFLLMIIVVGMVFLGLYVTAQKNLGESRDQLKASVAEIEKRYQQYVNSKTQPEGETVSILPASDDSGNKTSEDTITALEQMDVKIKLLESEERKHNGCDAIYYTETYWDEFPEYIKQQVKNFFKENHDLILEIRQLAATGGPFGRLDFSQGSSIEVPHLSRIMNCRLLLESHAFLASLSGDYEEAAKDYVAIMQFADGVSKEPVFTSQLSKNSTFDKVFEGIVTHVSSEVLSPDMTMRIIKQVSQMIRRDVYAESKKIDTFNSHEYFDKIKTGDSDLNQDVSVMLRDKANTFDFFLAQVHGSIFMRPFLMMDEEAYMDTMERISEISQHPFYEAKPMFDQIAKELENLPRTSLVSRAHLPFTITHYPEYQARYEAKVGLLQVGLAIELHHRQYGTYPQMLDEIAPTLGGEIPLDPYTGEYFVYKPKEDNFLLYSARSTVVDDPAGAQFVSYTDHDGNLVWRGTRDWRESEDRAQAE